jgi:hypothetical protein
VAGYYARELVHFVRRTSLIAAYAARKAIVDETSARTAAAEVTSD